MSVPYTRELSYVLRDQLDQTGARMAVYQVVAVPNATHVTVVEGGAEATIPRISSYQPKVGEPAYCLAADTLIVALGAVGGTPVPLAGHTIRDEGAGLPARAGLDFVGPGVTASDNAGADKTVVTVAGGGLPVVQAYGPQGSLTITAPTATAWTGGPSITIPATGTYLIYFGGRMQSAVTGLYDLYIWLYHAGAGITAVLFTAAAQYNGASGTGMSARACTAGQVLTLYVQCNLSGNFTGGWITAMQIAA